MNKTEKIFALINHAAETGAVCPSNAELTRAIGLVSTSNASVKISELETQGRLVVHRSLLSRTVTIVATGKSTAESKPYLDKPKTRADYAKPRLGPVLRDNTRRGMVVSRDPCFRCGVRGDIGCAHQARFDPVPLADAGR